MIECWPEAAIETRSSTRKYGQPRYRVAFSPAGGRRRATPAGWYSSEDKAWEAACAGLGLRGRRAGVDEQGGGTVGAPRSVAELCTEHGIDARALAARSGVDEQRVTAIVLGRWTPSPEDRDAIAAVFGLTRDHIRWGQGMPVQHLYGQGPA